MLLESQYHVSRQVRIGSRVCVDSYVGEERERLVKDVVCIYDQNSAPNNTEHADLDRQEHLGEVDPSVTIYRHRRTVLQSVTTVLVQYNLQLQKSWKEV